MLSSVVLTCSQIGIYLNVFNFMFRSCVFLTEYQFAIIITNILIFNEIFNIGFPEIIYYLKTRLIQEGLLGKAGRVNTSKEILFKKSFHDAPEIYRNAIWSSSLGHIFDLNNYSLIKPLIFIIVITKLYESFENFYKEAISLIKRNDNLEVKFSSFTIIILLLFVVIEKKFQTLM